MKSDTAVLSGRYASERSPDRLRAPVRLRTAAAAIGLPYSTAWRQAQLLSHQNLITRRGSGWVVTTAQMSDPAVNERMMALHNSYLRRIEALIAAGLDPVLVASSYNNCRPPLIPFG